MPMLLARFATNETGAAAIQYCLIAAGIGLAVFGAVKLAGPSVKEMFSNMATGTGNEAPAGRDFQSNY